MTVGSAQAVAAILAGSPELLVAPVLALVAAALLLRERPSGPAIHDRELDQILAAGAAVAAVALLIGQVVEPARALGVLAAAPAAVVVLALGVGARRLWHARAVPALLVLGWPAPWQLLPDTPAVHATAVALVAGPVLVLLARRLRPGVRPLPAV
ncbi:hypothetical protein [Pseudonocardia sediminis]|uniref:hypothetical protein n=1 Tax=Pseudonocardia sediminis TaxID=1397368 RepID=UPI001028F26F|nr:hypothetical protein [Pseudonocardia sediminis]